MFLTILNFQFLNVQDGTDSGGKGGMIGSNSDLEKYRHTRQITHGMIKNIMKTKREEMRDIENDNDSESKKMEGKIASGAMKFAPHTRCRLVRRRKYFRR